MNARRPAVKRAVQRAGPPLIFRLAVVGETGGVAGVVAGHVAVRVRLSARRPDGRTMDGPQVVLVTVEGGRVRAIEQFVGEPAAVAAFWA